MSSNLLVICVSLAILVNPLHTQETDCTKYQYSDDLTYSCDLSSAETCSTRGCCWDEETNMCHHSTDTVYTTESCTYIKAFAVEEGYATFCTSFGSASGGSPEACIQDACDQYEEDKINAINYNPDGGSCYVRNCILPLVDAHLELNNEFGGRDIWVRVLDYCSNLTICGPGTCLQTSARAYSCNCPQGLTGFNCEKDVDDCVEVTCNNGGLCVDALNSYSCDCPEGYDGDHCEIDNYNCAIDSADRIDCDSSTQDECLFKGCCWVDGSCFHGHNTTMTLNGSCTYILVHQLEEGLATYCSDDSAVSSHKDSLLQCLTDACEGGVDLYNAVNMYLGISCYLRKCDTPITEEHLKVDVTVSEYVGRDIWIRFFDYCSADDPCQNGGDCINTERYFTCECEPGYEGDVCDTDINECQSSPCLHGDCSDGVNGYTCLCVDGYAGVHCDMDIDECSSNPCQNGGTCGNYVNYFTCECPQGFSSDLCEIDIDDCVDQPCVHGTCVDGVNEYSCDCGTSHIGQHCEQEIDECESNPCLHEGVCADQVDHYTCDCSLGYTGVDCELDLDECSSNPCVEGECTDQFAAYSCECSTGFTGTNCDIDIDECSSDPCVQGECLDGVNKYTCQCFPGFTGTLCTEEMDECSSNPCQNEGTCTDQLDYFTCECLEGYTGTMCETDEQTLGTNNAQEGSESDSQQSSSNTQVGTVVGATVPIIVAVTGVALVTGKVLYNKWKKKTSQSKVSPEASEPDMDPDLDPDGLAFVPNNSCAPVRHVDSYVPNT